MATTLTNISRWISGGFARAQYSISSSGRPYNSAVLEPGDIAGMTVLEGAKSANVQIPEAEILQIPGDDTVRGVIQFPGNALPTFDMVFSDLTTAFVNALQGTLAVSAQNIYEWLILDPANRIFPDIFLMLSRRAPSTEAGATGNGYETLVFPQSTVTFKGVSGFQTGANAGEYTFGVTINRTSILPWGTPLTKLTHGTTGGSGFVFWSQYIPTFDVAIKDGIITDWTLTQALANNAQAIGWKTVSDVTSTDAVTVDALNNQVDSVAVGAEGDILTLLYEAA